MYNTNDILEMLRNDKTPEELAKEFTEKLNAAIAAHKKEEEEKLAAARSAENKVKDTMDLLDTVSYYLNTYYPSLTTEEMATEEDAKAAIALLDSVSAPTRTSLFDNFFNIFKF